MENNVLRGCGGIIVKDKETLLFRRINTATFNNMWSNAVGKIEHGESAEQAVLREMHEELGIKVKIIKKLTDYHDVSEQKLLGIYSGFLVEIIEGTPEIKEPDKAKDLAYFPLSNLPEDLTPYCKEYIDAYLKGKATFSSSLQ